MDGMMAHKPMPAAVQDGFQRGRFPHSMMHPLLQFIRGFAFLDMAAGPWIAGGAVRRILTGETCGGDIDIFLPTKDVAPPDGIGQPNLDVAEHVIRELRRRPDCGSATRNRTTELITIRDIKVQVVTNKGYSNAESLLSDFDFTVTMAATDGTSWMTHQRFHEDVAAGRLALNKDQRRKRQIIRLTKYAMYGFTPEPGVLKKMLRVEESDFGDIVMNNLHLAPTQDY